MAAGGMQQRSVRCCSRGCYREIEHSEFAGRGQLQNRLGVPFRSALRVHGSEGLRRDRQVRCGEQEYQLLRPGWTLRVRRPACRSVLR
jgi:hypothetical protein